MVDTVQILDCTVGRLPDDPEVVLLDGKGGRLASGAEPVYLDCDFDSLEAGVAVNSRGEPFAKWKPECTPDSHFKRPDGKECCCGALIYDGNKINLRRITAEERQRFSEEWHRTYYGTDTTERTEK